MHRWLQSVVGEPTPPPSQNNTYIFHFFLWAHPAQWYKLFGNYKAIRVLIGGTAGWTARHFQWQMKNNVSLIDFLWSFALTKSWRFMWTPCSLFASHFFFFLPFLLKTCQWDRTEENIALRWEVASSFDRRTNFNKCRFWIFGCISCPEASYQPAWHTGIFFLIHWFTGYGWFNNSFIIFFYSTCIIWLF